MKCNKKNCPLVGNNENCDIKDCKWRTETAELKRGEVNAVKEYEDAIFQLEHNKINLDSYEITALIWAMNEYIHNGQFAERI